MGAGKLRPAEATAETDLTRAAYFEDASKSLNLLNSP